MMGKSGKTLDVGIILAGLGKGKKGPPGMAPKPEPESDEEPMGVSEEDYSAAAAEVRDALKSSDDAKLSRALKAFYDLCCSDESEPEIEDDTD